MTRKPEIVNRKPEKTAGLLELDGITHTFGDLRVLDDVSLQVEAGDSVAVVGPNGAGKTTLMRVAAGLLEPDAGRVHLSGEPRGAMSRREAARRVAYLRQAAPQVFDFSALELVLMGFHARTGRFSLPSEDQRDRALQAMGELEIRHLADRSASVLSGGELQRVLMARTLVSGAEVWLLDEPTSHLDVRHQMALLRQVGAHVDEGGAALAVFHDLSLVHRIFDRVAVMAEGRIVACGPTGETLSEELLEEVFGVGLLHGEVDGRPVWVVE